MAQPLPADPLPAAPCQSCNILTPRKCSVCSVCTYCSTECETKAETLCFAGVACKLHLAWPREDTNLGSAGAHFLMLPSVQTPLTTSDPPHMRWTGLHQAAVHYLHVLLACSSSKVFHKTVFGTAIVLTQDGRYASGCQRINFPVGKTSQAASMMVGNMAQLALAMLGEESTRSPQLRDHGAPDDRQALVLSGVVSCSALHFDAIYLTHTNDTWTIKRIQPLWEQVLTPLDDKYYSMSFKPQGRVPDNSRHSLELVEKALMPQDPAEALAAAAAAAVASTRTPSQSPTPASSARPETELMPAFAVGATQAQAAARQLPRATPRQTPSPTPQPWEAYRAQAQALAEAQTEAPLWLDQLQAALQRA